MRDLSVAFRSLRRTPGFSVTALIAIGLGIGSATTVFSVTDHLLFKPLPYAQPDRLVTVGADVRSRGQSNWAVAPPEYDAWRQEIKTLTDLGGYQTFGRYSLTLPEAPVEVAVNRITENFLSVLGVAPAIGRQFAAADFVIGAPPVLLLTDRAWRRHFGARRDIVGQFLTVNGRPAEVAGVLPRAFAFPSASRDQPDVIVPLVRTKESSGSGIVMVGRLAVGRTIEEAREEINALAAFRAAETFMRNARIDGATVEPLADALSKTSRAVLQLLLGAVLVLLLIGCANVANLLLARGADRRGELAVRTALGATRASLVRLMLMESSLLAVAGGILGAAFAVVAIGVLGPLVPADLQRLGPAVVDGRALVFAALASAVVVLIAGTGPAFAAARANLSPTLAQTSGRSTGARWRIRQVLVGLEVALAVVLLVAGGLMVNSIVRVLGVDTGYTPESVLTMRVQIPRGKEYPKRSKEFTDRVITAARGVAGVVRAGASDGVPLGNTLMAGHYRVEGFPYKWIGEAVPKGSGACCSQTQWVTTGFFDAAGISLVRGRTFNEADAAKAPQVALIGESLARRFPAGLDPIGHYLTSAEEGSTDNSDRRLIVGIVRDVRDMTLERAALPTFYYPMEERGSAAMTLWLRTSVDPESVAGAVQKAIQQSAGPVIITDVLTFGDVMKKSVGGRHLNAWLFGSFGALGLLLAVIGIGSVVSFSVARRTREMGLRIALGARPVDVQRLVVGESMIPVAVGLVVGVGAALMLSRLAESLLFDVQPRDTATYLTVCALLALAAVIAAILPARRAARVNPLVALRAE